MVCQPRLLPSHGPGGEIRLEQCRSGLRELLEAKKTYDLIFTSSATESNNMAILGRKYESRDEILFSEAYHPSLVRPLGRTSARLRSIPLEQGRVTPRSLSQALSAESKLLLLEHVNGQSGLICDIIGCAKMAKRIVGDGLHVHVDASQSFTKLPLSLESEDVDSLALSGHKIGAPRGAAALVAKRYTVGPIILGGGQEQGLRSGTENLPALWAFYQCALQGGDLEYLKMLKAELLQGLQFKGHSFPFEQGLSVDHICTFCYRGPSPQHLLERLDGQRIFISRGPACSSGDIQYRENLSHLGLSSEDGERILRVSLSFESTTEEIKTLLDAL